MEKVAVVQKRVADKLHLVQNTGCVSGKMFGRGGSALLDLIGGYGVNTKKQRNSQNKGKQQKQQIPFDLSCVFSG